MQNEGKAEIKPNDWPQDRRQKKGARILQKDDSRRGPCNGSISSHDPSTLQGDRGNRKARKKISCNRKSPSNSMKPSCFLVETKGGTGGHRSGHSLFSCARLLQQGRLKPKPRPVERGSQTGEGDDVKETLKRTRIR